MDNLYTTIGFDNGSVLSHVECARTGLTMQSFDLPSSGSYDDAETAASIVMDPSSIVMTNKFIHTSSGGKDHPSRTEIAFRDEMIYFIHEEDGAEEGFYLDGPRLMPINDDDMYIGSTSVRVRRIYTNDIRIYVDDSTYFNADDILTACGLI